MAAALAFAAAVAPGCRETTPENERIERTLLEHRVEALERLVARGERLIPFDQALVSIDQTLLRDLIAASLPYETTVGDRFRVRVLAATVSCERGLAYVRLEGRVSLLGQPESTLFSQAIVHGALRRFDLESDESVLRGRVEVIGFEIERVKLPGGESGDLRELLRDLAELRLEAFQGMEYAFDIPVRLVDDLVLPEFEAEDRVRIPEARIPLRAEVTDVTAVRGRLWIALRLGGFVPPPPSGRVAARDAR